MADFDPTKPVQTRDGRSARILCTDRISDAGNIVALVRIGRGVERVLTYYAAGHILEDGRKSHSDLVNVPERESLFYNVYCSHAATKRHATLEDARASVSPYTYSYLGTIEIVREGGEGGVIVERKIHNLLENDNG